MFKSVSSAEELIDQQEREEKRSQLTLQKIAIQKQKLAQGEQEKKEKEDLMKNTNPLGALFHVFGLVCHL